MVNKKESQIKKSPFAVSEVRYCAIEAAKRIYAEKTDTNFITKNPWHLKTISKYGEAYYRGFIDGAHALLKEIEATPEYTACDDENFIHAIYELFEDPKNI